MAWFSGKVSLGNFPDLAGAVNKLSESVKNIEKNFDSALGFEEKSESSGEASASGLWPSASDRKALFDPVMAFMGQKGEESTVESSENPKNLQLPSSVEDKEAVEMDRSASSATEQTTPSEEANEVIMAEKDGAHPDDADGTPTVKEDPGKAQSDAKPEPVQPSKPTVEITETTDSLSLPEKKENSEVESPDSLQQEEPKSVINEVDLVEDSDLVPDQSNNTNNLYENTDEQQVQQEASEIVSLVLAEALNDSHTAAALSERSDIHPVSTEGSKSSGEFSKDRLPDAFPVNEDAEMVGGSVSQDDASGIEVEAKQLVNENETDGKEHRLSSGNSVSNSADSVIELEKLKMEMKMMETALQGAARQAQAKADEIARMMNENEKLKAVIDDLRRKSYDAEVESLRDEYHQRVATLERKVYALTKERDTLRREHNKKSDAAALLKEKDEIINQVMAEGEELSKKQASQESHIRKLRAQIRELEEEKKGLSTRLQVEENKVESIKRDKASTEKVLQEAIERHHAELATQKEYYTNALSAAKEAETLAEARVNNEARTELESRLREAGEREAMLVQTLEELRQTLSRNEQQANFREDMLRRDVEDLQKRYQASERRCEELITQVPESTRPLLRQIEAMQETTGRRAEAWAAVERSLNSRLQEAEAKAAAAEERERSVNERLTQTLSRINVLEAQISCLRAEQTQLSRSLEKERQRAAENRQEYLAAKEEADTQEGRVNQLEEEIRQLRRKHKQELQESLSQRELLQQEIEREKSARLDLERTSRPPSSAVVDQSPLPRHNSAFDNGNLTRKLSSASSLGSMEEGYFLQASLDSSDSFAERRNFGESTMSPYHMKSMTSNAFEASLRQKEGELASYMSRLASLESIRDSLAEELVKMTAQCEKLRTEAATVPGIRAELEALRRRHSAALELMGERDEELEELRNDIVDLKEMYREQVNLLVNKIQVLGST